MQNTQADNSGSELKLPEFLHMINTIETVAGCVHPIGVDVIRRVRRNDVNIKLCPDPDISVRKIRIGKMTALVLSPAM